MKMTKKLGEGSYGMVFLTKGDTKHVYKIFLDHENPYDLLEVDILFRLHHPHLIRGTRLFTSDVIPQVGKSFEMYTDGRGPFLIVQMPRAQCDLFEWRYGAHTFEEKMYVFWQTVLALQFLHRNRILHMDIKPENILLFSKNQIQLADFGLCISTASHEQRRSYEETLITPTYRPPEQVLEGDEMGIYSQATDVWSLGVLLTEIFLPPTRKYFLENKDLKRMKKLFETPEATNRTLRTKMGRIYQTQPIQRILPLIRSMIQYRPQDRIQIKALLHDPLFEELGFQRPEDPGYALQSVHRFPQINDTALQVQTFLRDSLQFLKLFYEQYRVEYPLQMFFVALDLFLRYQPYLKNSRYSTGMALWFSSILFGSHPIPLKYISRYVHKSLSPTVRNKMMFLRSDCPHSFLFNTPFDSAFCTCRIQHYLQLLFRQPHVYLQLLQEVQVFDPSQVPTCHCQEIPSWDLSIWIPYMIRLQDSSTSTYWTERP